MGRAFDRVAEVVSGRVVADGDNLCLEFERFIADGLAIKWVGHDGDEVAFREPKTGMSVPGNFHKKEPPKGDYTRWAKGFPALGGYPIGLFQSREIL